MTSNSSNGPYAVKVPRRATESLRSCLPASVEGCELAPDIRTEISRLESDPELGEEFDDNLWIFAFRILRPPAVYRVAAQYSILARQHWVLIHKFSVSEM